MTAAYEPKTDGLVLAEGVAKPARPNYSSVTQPVEASFTSLMYLYKTPDVTVGFGVINFCFLFSNS